MLKKKKIPFYNNINSRESLLRSVIFFQRPIRWGTKARTAHLVRRSNHRSVLINLSIENLLVLRPDGAVCIPLQITVFPRDLKHKQSETTKKETNKKKKKPIFSFFNLNIIARNTPTGLNSAAFFSVERPSRRLFSKNFTSYIALAERVQ